MLFPNCPRVVYKKNTLESVICQLRFPPILKIDAEIPASFQDEVRNEFPNYSEIIESKLDIPLEMARRNPNDLFTPAIKPENSKNHEFISADGDWKINLTRTFLAFSTRKYERWEDFFNKMQLPINALIRIYRPVFFNRIGLRYINVIKRTQIGLKEIAWKELLNPALIGILQSSDINTSVESFECTQNLNLENGRLARISTRIKKDADEDGFIIDGDFFTTNHVSNSELKIVLDSLHSQSTCFIRWAITEKLHNALEPNLI